MKADNLFSRKSFLRTCLTYFLLCSLLVFLVNAIVNMVVAVRLEHAFPSIDLALAYEDALQEDDFAAVSLRRLGDCAFLIFDENDRLLYATDNRLKDYIHPEDLWLLNSADNSLYYTVSETTDQTGALYYYIALSCQHEETGVVEFIDYCIVDPDYAIVEGNLFPGLERLTERQFDLLQGVYRREWEISRYEYSTADGEARTMVFAAPLLTDEAYARTLARANRLYLLSLPALAAVIFALAALFSRKVRRSIRPLNDAIVAYGAGRRIAVEQDRLPHEFQYVTDSFTRLLDHLSQADAAREKATQEKQRMIADISHDLKTPLTVIQGYAQALKDGIVPPEKQTQYLDTICRKAAASTELMDTLFSYARLDHPDYTLQAETGDLCEFIKAYLAEKYTELENAGFALVPNLPETPVMCCFDPRLLRRLLENLTGNALKYNPGGTTLFFALRAQEDRICLTVADNGTGIPKAIRETLFEPFVIGDQARTTGCGTGLGMAIVKRIVDLHHGTIRLVYPPQQGCQTEFEIILPRRRGQEQK